MKNSSPLTPLPPTLNPARGFTLIEMLVAVTLFVFVIMIAVGTLLNLTKANDRAQAVLVALNNLDFAIEHMSRNLRTGAGYGNPVGQSSIAFTDSYGRAVTYSLTANMQNNRGRVVRTKDGVGPIALTADEIDIRELAFYIDGTDTNDNKQPRVLITISGRTAVSSIKENEQSEFHLQTTVSQRTPDI